MSRFKNLKQLFSDAVFIRSLLIGGVAFALSLSSVFYSADYATTSASNSVTDIILSNTRVYDVALLFVYGAVVAVIFSFIVGLTVKLHAAPFVLKTAALLLFIRSIFVSLTHVSPYPYHAALADTYFASTRFTHMFFTGDDQFFSGHVGLTFMMALIFWDTPALRYIYLGISTVFAVTVLLGHLHYSIDVFAAYFITYTIYTMAVRLFKKDFERAQA